jgi:hypothetical protein
VTKDNGGLEVVGVGRRFEQGGTQAHSTFGVEIAEAESWMKFGADFGVQRVRGDDR